jgi:hypothetical protein
MQQTIHRSRQITPSDWGTRLLLGLNLLEHLDKAWSFVLLPTAIPFVDLLGIKVEIKQDRRSFGQGPKKNAPAEKIALPNELSNRKSDTDCLRNDHAGHFLVI